MSETEGPTDGKVSAICPQCGSERRNEFIEDFLEDSGCSPSHHHSWHDLSDGKEEF